MFTCDQLVYGFSLHIYNIMMYMCELYLPVGTLGTSLPLVNRKCTFSGAFDVCGFRDTKLCDSCFVHYLQDLHSVRCLCDNLFNSLVQDHFL